MCLLVFIPFKHFYLLFNAINKVSHFFKNFFPFNSLFFSEEGKENNSPNLIPYHPTKHKKVQFTRSPEKYLSIIGTNTF